VTLNEDALLADAFKIMKEFKIGGIPIINGDQQLKGIITNPGPSVFRRTPPDRCVM